MVVPHNQPIMFITGETHQLGGGYTTDKPLCHQRIHISTGVPVGLRYHLSTSGFTGLVHRKIHRGYPFFKPPVLGVSQVDVSRLSPRRKSTFLGLVDLGPLRHVMRFSQASVCVSWRRSCKNFKAFSDCLGKAVLGSDADLLGISTACDRWTMARNNMK